MDTGGEMRPTGDLQVRRFHSAALEAAIAAESNTVSFGRAWLTASQDGDGRVTTMAHATANYNHRGEQRECHVAFEVTSDERIEAAFADALEANIGRLVSLAMDDARSCTVAAKHNTDIIGGRE